MADNIKRPKVSVIIPVYNSAPYLDKCIRSIQDQSMSETEIICVNDGSTDNSSDILSEFAKSDDRIMVYDQINSGQSAARNSGLKLAQGKYIYFMDSDDYLDPEALLTLYELAEKEDTDIIYFDGDSFSESDGCEDQLAHYSDYYQRKGSYPDEVCSGKELMSEMVRNNEYRVSPCLQFINRQFILDNNLWFYEGIIHEDNLFNFECMIEADKAIYLHKVLFYRRIRPSSTMTQNISFANARGYFYCFIEMEKFCHTVYIEEDYIPAVTQLLKNMLHNSRDNYMQLSEEEKEMTGTLPLYDSMLFKFYVTEFCDQKSSVNELRNRIKKINAEKAELNQKFNTASKEKEKLSKENERLKVRSEEIENSTTFKVGNLILYFPKKVKNFILNFKR